MYYEVLSDGVMDCRSSSCLSAADDGQAILIAHNSPLMIQYRFASLNILRYFPLNRDKNV